MPTPYSDRILKTMKHPSPITEEVKCCNLCRGVGKPIPFCEDKYECKCHSKVEDSKKCTCKDSCSRYDHGLGCSCDVEDCSIHNTSSPLNQAPESKEWEELYNKKFESITGGINPWKFKYSTPDWRDLESLNTQIKEFLQSQISKARSEGYKQGIIDSGKHNEDYIIPKKVAEARSEAQRDCVEKLDKFRTNKCPVGQPTGYCCNYHYYLDDFIKSLTSSK